MKQSKPQMARKALREKRLSYLIENELEKAELVIAIKSISDKLQDMAENLAKIEADNLMPMSDSLKTAFGPQIASQFTNVTTAKLRELVTAIGAAKGAIGNETMRLEKAINGEPTNDMAMPEPETDSSSEGESEGSQDVADMNADNSGAPTPPESNASPESSEDDFQADMNQTAAGRAKKENANIRGRRLVEYKSADFDSNLSNLAMFHGKSGVLAFEVRDMIEDGRFDGEERKALGNVLSHLASCAEHHQHWDDPDAKVMAALQAAHVDTRLPEIVRIVSKLKKLAHMISFKHEGMVDEAEDFMPTMMESKNNKSNKSNIKKLSESKNPDAVILSAFRRSLKETRNPARSVHMTAKSFGIDSIDVVSIVREAKKASTKTSVKKKVVKEFVMKPTPKSKRGMFDGVSQADLRKRLTAAKKRMKSHEDKGEEVPHKLRSEVSELNFALRAKHNWGKVSETSLKSAWMALMDGDTRLSEAVPQGSRSPSEMHADRANSQGGTRQVTGQTQAAPASKSVTNTAPTNKSTTKPAVSGSSANPTTSTQAPNNSQPAQVPPQAGQKPVQQQPAIGQTPSNQTPSGQPVSGKTQFSKSSVGNQTGGNQTENRGNSMPEMPGKVTDTVPSTGVTMMSKQGPFPKPGPSLMNTAPSGSQSNNVAESRFPTRRIMVRK